MTDFEIIRSVLFIAAGIGGSLVLIWIGFRQRGHGDPVQDIREERTERRDLLASSLPEGVLVDLRRVAIDAESAAKVARSAAANATRDGDAEIAEFLEQRAEVEEDVADRALDLLRSRSRPRAPSPGSELQG